MSINNKLTDKSLIDVFIIIFFSWKISF